jgi:hypothetical protein
LVERGLTAAARYPEKDLAQLDLRTEAGLGAQGRR